MILFWSRKHPIYGATKLVPMCTMWVQDQGKTYTGAANIEGAVTTTAFMPDDRYDIYTALRKIVRKRLEIDCPSKTRS